MSLTGSALSGKRVLITGGTGFIGSRLVERLALEENARPRVLVRDFAKAARVARLPVEMVRGDVLNAADVQRAAEGSEAIFHCAYGTAPDETLQRRVNVEGTRNVLDAALRAKVKRVVHFSSLMVYGVTADGDLDETARRRQFGNVYSDSKLDAERLAFDYIRQQRLPVVILQPTAVYGPFAQQWTINVWQKMKTGRLILVNSGDGLRNAVYIDDLVSAAVLAAVKKEAIGEAFLISGDTPVTWREFYRAFESMLGVTDRLVNLSAGEAKTLYTKSKKAKSVLAEMRALAGENPEVRHRLLKSRELAFMARWARTLIGGGLRRRLKNRKAADELTQVGTSAALPERLHLIDPATIDFQAAKTTVRIDKARRLLGYRPAFEFSRGMQLTERWARWANLLDSTHPVLREPSLEPQRAAS